MFTGCNQNKQEETTVGIETRETLEPLEISEQDMDVSVRDGVWENAVVASAHPIASLIGVRILQRGGNAVDAAVGTSFALGLLEPNASGPGGGGYMTIKMTDEEPVFLDYRCVSPMEVDIEAYLELSEYDRNNGIYSIAIPGAVDGWINAHEMYGRLEMEIVLEDIIMIAEKGFEVGSELESILIDSYGKLLSDDAAGSLFLNEGLAYSRDEIFVNKGYAFFLRTIIEEGRDGFYNGTIATKIIESIEQKNGWISAEDLKYYESVVKEPLTGSYREYEIITAPPSSSGGVAIIESMNMIEKFNMRDLRLEDAKGLDLMAQILRMADTDRFAYIGDSMNNEDVINYLISKEYADKRIHDFNEGSLEEIVPGIVDDESESTSHFSIVDKEGNAVSVTNTLGYFFGSGIAVEEFGFVLNNQMYDFDAIQGEINSVEGNKRPRSSMAPTIVTKNNEVILVLGSPGGKTIPGSIVQVLINILDLEMNLKEAVSFPRFSIDNNNQLILEEGYQVNDLQLLEEKGYKINRIKSIGAIQGILKNSNGSYEGVSDFRRGGKPSGY